MEKQQAVIWIALLRLSSKSVFPPFQLSTISLILNQGVYGSRASSFRSGLMATHQRKMTPRLGGRQEENIPLKCTTCRYTEFNVMGKSLGLTSLSPQREWIHHSLGHNLPEMKRKWLINIPTYSISKLTNRSCTPAFFEEPSTAFLRS